MWIMKQGAREHEHGRYAHFFWGKSVSAAREGSGDLGKNGEGDPFGSVVRMEGLGERLIAD